MYPATHRRPRASRKADIPRSFVSKWQNAAPKVKLRRPVTACQTCRAAKVKCDGQQDCSRCSSRGIACSYLNVSSSDTQSLRDLQSGTNMAILSQDLSAEAPLTTAFAERPTPSSTSSLQNNGDFDSTIDWALYGNHHQIDEVHWQTESAHKNASFLML
jgi:hypothetical protein